MTEMSNPQKNLILAAHHRPAKATPYGGRGEIVLSSRLAPSGEVLRRNGWAIQGDHGWLNVTRAGLIAAGVDMDALHAEALAENAGYVRWYPATTPQDRSADGVPEVEQDDRENAGQAPHVRNNCGRKGGCAQCTSPATIYPERYPNAYRDAPITPAEQRTGVSDVQASIADDVATLREAVKAAPNWDWRRQDALDRLDRIAAQVPQRAARMGRPMFQHACGHVDAPPYDTPGRCAHCGARSADGKGWRALYTFGGA